MDGPENFGSKALNRTKMLDNMMTGVMGVDVVKQIQQQIAANREINRQSMQLSEYHDNDEEEQTELLALNNNEKKKDRLDYFTKDSDYYTTLLLMIVKQQGDVELP